MSETPLPADLRAFLKEHVWSLDHLQALLLVRREPQREWTADDGAAALKTASDIAAAALAHLDARSLAARLDGNLPRYRYLPPPAEIEGLIGRLDDEFRSDPIAIITCLSADAIERMRTAAMRAFADSFIIRRNRDG